MTATFDPGWLQRREPFDAQARAQAAVRLRLSDRLQSLRPPAGTPWRVIDLACGTGANLRWLAPRLEGPQQWLLVDRDPHLLWRASSPAAGVDVVRQRRDLATSLETLPWHAAHLVTASALLDLVGEAWLRRLVTACAGARVPLLLALSVDGRHRWRPRDAGDAEVGQWFAAHQRRDKGLGPALGERAIPTLLPLLRATGYRVFQARSDWWLDGARDGRAGALQKALIDGMAAAAIEQAPHRAPRVNAWRERRRALAPRACLRVGHLDVLALPP